MTRQAAAAQYSLLRRSNSQDGFAPVVRE